MSYIKKLQNENKALRRQVANYEANFSSLRAYLHGPKFTGEEQGERKDWISTGDVLNWLRDVEHAADHARENPEMPESAEQY